MQSLFPPCFHVAVQSRSPPCLPEYRVLIPSSAILYIVQWHLRPTVLAYRLCSSLPFRSQTVESRDFCWVPLVPCIAPCMQMMVNKYLKEQFIFLISLSLFSLQNQMFVYSHLNAILLASGAHITVSWVLLSPSIENNFGTEKWELLLQASPSASARRSLASLSEWNC